MKQLLSLNHTKEVNDKNSGDRFIEAMDDNQHALTLGKGKPLTHSVYYDVAIRQNSQK